MNTYDLGDLVALTGRFYSDAALTTLADPTDVTLSIRDPDRIITTPAVDHPGVGIFTYSWIPTKPGLHEYNWTGTGDVVSADQGPVYIKVGIDPGLELCTLAEVRQALRLQTTEQDGLIEEMIAAATVAIRNRYQREFAPAGTLTRTFEVTSTLVNLAPYDLQSAESLTLDPGGDQETTLVATDYKLRPTHSLSGTYYLIRLRRGLVLPSMCDFGYAELAIAGEWGFPEIDKDVRRAAVITASAWVDRGAESYAMPNMDTDGPNPYPARPETWAIPSSAHSLLQRYERMVVA